MATLERQIIWNYFDSQRVLLNHCLKYIKDMVEEHNNSISLRPTNGRQTLLVEYNGSFQAAHKLFLNDGEVCVKLDACKDWSIYHVMPNDIINISLRLYDIEKELKK